MNLSSETTNRDARGTIGCALLIILALGAVALVSLFVPRYDLEIATKPGPSGYTIVENNFWSVGAARKAAAKYPNYDWAALEKTGWGQLFNKYSPDTRKMR